MAPEATLAPLHKADGSATYTSSGYTILCAVNGPLEVPRRDELPSEAFLEINVRPSIGVGTPKERHLETLLHSTLRSIILTRWIPRTLVQITLQIHSTPQDVDDLGVNASLLVLPHLVHAAVLALIDSGIPLRSTCTAVLVAIPTSNSKSKASEPILSPTPQDLIRARRMKSVHVFAFAGDGKMILNESDGVFSFEEWDDAAGMAEYACCRDQDEGGVSLGEGMQGDGKSDNLEEWLRTVVRGKVEREQAWRVAA